MSDVENQLASVLDKAVAGFLVDLPQLIKEQLKGKVATLLGFRQWSNGKWDVDSRNENGPAISLIKASVQVAVKEAVEKQQWRPTPKFMEAIEEAFQNAFRYDMQERLRAIAKDQARKVEEHIRKTLDENLNKLLPTLTLKEISDPQFMANMPQLRDLVSKALVEGTVSL